MSNKSNNQGRAYEFACLLALAEEIEKFRIVEVLQNSSYFAAQRAWDILSEEKKAIYKASARVAVIRILQLEPRICEQEGDRLELLLQADAKGEKGDVRDILIVRKNIQWEIGLSIKHNHFAAKHNRLSKTLDFGKKWYGVPCSPDYWKDVKPVFDYLDQEKIKHTEFEDLPDKEGEVYVPLLKAFMNEITRQYAVHKDISGKLVEYLLGKYDFYKVVSMDRLRTTRIQSYNLHGTLNLPGKTRKATIEVPIAALPTRIIHFDFVPGKTNTVELYMDGGWQFSFRIHNAETYVKASLKFDIQIIGMPAAIITINCNWRS